MFTNSGSFSNGDSDVPELELLEKLAFENFKSQAESRKASSAGDSKYSLVAELFAAILGCLSKLRLEARVSSRVKQCD